LSLLGYKNSDNLIIYLFDDETVPNGFSKFHISVEVVKSTYDFFLENSMLDSMKTIHDLDKILTMDAEQEREDKAYHAYLKTL